HQTIPARALSTALDRMAGDGSRGEPVPIIGRPSELVNHGTESEAGVGGAPGYYDLGTLVECLRNRAAPEVYVCALDQRQDRLERFAGVEVSEFDASADVVLEPVHDVITGYDAHLHSSGKAPPVDYAGNGVPAGFGIHAAGVCDNLDIALEQV